MKYFQTLKALNSDQKRVIYAYLCTLTIGSLASVLSFGFGATLLFFLSPIINIHFARSNRSKNVKKDNDRILTLNYYAGYFKISHILMPCLILALFLLIAFCFDHYLFGFFASLLILTRYSILSFYLIRHKLPLLGAKPGRRRDGTDDLPTLKFRSMQDDVFNRTLTDPKYSSIPGNIFNDAYRPKSHS